MDENRELTQGEEQIGRLIAAAGPGATASADVRARVYAATRSRWDQVTQQRKAAQLRQRTVRLRVVGLAATVAAAAATFFFLQDTTPPVPGAATLAALVQARGDAVVIRAGQRLTPSEAAGLEAGDVLRTGAGGQVALALTDGMSLRINTDSDVELTDSGHLNLVAGTIYLDSGSDGSGALEVVTPLGTVEHLGTQYEVHVGDAALRLRVREGSVAYRGPAGDLTSEAGQQLDVTGSGQTNVTAIAADDAAWDWAESLAALAPADAYVIGDVIAWAARELALEVNYTNPLIQSLWTTDTLTDLDNFSPAEALEAIESATDTALSIRDGLLTIGD